jgi:putative transposase
VLEFPGYGYRRITKTLTRAGYLVNHKRVLRIMREESLLCQLKRRFVPTTDSKHSFRTYPNLLKETVLYAPDQAWLRQTGKPTSHTYDCPPALLIWRQ